MLQKYTASLIIVTVIASVAGAQAQRDPFASNTGRRQEAGSNVIASVEFVDAPINTVFKMISDLTGWSIIMSPALSEKPPRINIWLKDIPPEQALEQIAMVGGFIADRKDRIVQVMTFDEYARA